MKKERKDSINELNLSNTKTLIMIIFYTIQ